MVETVFIGLGSNLGSPADNIRTALDHINSIEGWIPAASSAFYENEPFGNTDQPRFVNAVTQGHCTLTPQTLLTELLQIEKEMGRVREEKWGPRLIDLDILFYGQQVIDSPDLRVPHPGIPERSFVLIPLGDLASEWVHPVVKKTVIEMIAELGTISGIHPLSDR